MELEPTRVMRALRLPLLLHQHDCCVWTVEGQPVGDREPDDAAADDQEVDSAHPDN
jgi:hypothetical protein